MTGITGVKACVFDAYGTLFDVNAAAAHLKEELGGKADQLSAVWRLKQLQYTWLRSLMGKAYVPFWQITGDSLDYAMESIGLKNDALRGKLLDLYRELDCYPEVPTVLMKLKEGGIDTAILSNGSPEMLDSAVRSAGVGRYLDAVLSVDSIGVFKPSPRVYELAPARFGIEPEQVCFMSSNAWDAAAAAHFGFQVVWINRFEQPRERLPGEPKAVLSSLDGLPGLLGL